MVRVLKTVFAPRLRELARQVNPARAQQVLNWAWRAQRVETWTDHADEVLIEAQAEERVAEQRRRTHATKTYSQWLESALRKVAGVAHRWTTQTITSAHSMDYQNSTTPQQSMQARTWGDRWNRDNEARHILMRQMQLLRQQALSTTPRQLDSGISAPYPVKHEGKPCWSFFFFFCRHHSQRCLDSRVS